MQQRIQSSTTANNRVVEASSFRKRKRSSNLANSSSSDESSASEDESESGQKRQRPNGPHEEGTTSDGDENEVNNRDELSRTKFAILRPRQRSVKQSIVKNRWETLGEKAQERVRALLDRLEKPLIAVHRSEKRRVESQAALSQLMRT
jgi:hypothetical protein